MTNLSPYLCCKDATRAIEFYRKAFGAKETMRLAEPSGRIGHAELEIKSTPYRDMIAKEYPIIVKMQRNACTFEDLDREDMVIVGDVDHCLRKVERYQRAGLDHFIALMQADRIPHAKVLRSIELFATRIMPHFR